MHNERGVNARSGKELYLLVAVSQQFRCRFWSHNRSRVTIERDYNSLAPQSFRFGLHMGNNRTVAFMHTVVCAYGDYRSTRRRSCGIGITKNKHE
jgi:hypothetical protein